MYTKEYVHTTHDVIHAKNKYINNTHLISLPSAGKDQRRKIHSLQQCREKKNFTEATYLRWVWPTLG